MKTITLKCGSSFVGIIEKPATKGNSYAEGFFYSNGKIIGRFNICSKSIKSVENVRI